MSDFKIKDITLYSFLILISGIILSTSLLYFSLTKISNLNKQMSQLINTQNSFLEMKLNTKELLITIDLESKIKQWKRSINIFDEKLKVLNFLKKKNIDDYWYTTKKEINEIKNILNNEFLKPYNLNQKSILMLKGELFANKDATEQYSVIFLLTRKLEYLLEYKKFIFDEFKELYKYEKENIDKQISATLYFTIFFIILILFIMIALIQIMNKKISKIEKELLNTKNNLNEKVNELTDSKILLQNIIDTVPASIFWKDENCIYKGVNKQIIKDADLISKYDIIGKNDYEMPWKDTEAKKYMDDDKEVMRTGKAKLQIEESQTKKDGSIIHVLTSKVPLKNRKNQILGVLGIYIDITEKKKMNEILLKKNRLLAQQSKMASLGEMIENIAHQWKQPLSIILSTTTGLKLKKEFKQLNEEFINTSIDNITESVEKLNEIVNDFRIFFKADKELKYFNISKVVNKAIILIQSKLENNLILIKKEINAFDAYGYENEFTQVIMNILSNSIDAFKENKIKDKLINIKINSIKNKEKDYKELEIKIYDNAGGIEEELLDKVFDAYFSTKTDESSGMGLHMAREIIKNNMKGSISVKNKEFEYKNKLYLGTEFTIVIPAQKYNLEN